MSPTRLASALATAVLLGSPGASAASGNANGRAPSLDGCVRAAQTTALVRLAPARAPASV